MHFGVIMLAAGASSRMGRPKLLLPWLKSTVLDHLVTSWRRCRAELVAVVFNPRDDQLIRELTRLRIPTSHRIPNPSPEDGMFSSIQCAARAAPQFPRITHWVLSLGDQPHLHWKTLPALIEFAHQHPHAICQPVHLGRPKHPVIFPQGIFLEIKDSAATNLRDFLRVHQNLRRYWPCQDDGLDLDLDYPRDYDKALAREIESVPPANLRT